MNKLLASVLSLIAVGLPVSGCGDDEDSGSAETTEAPADTSPDTSGAASQRTVEVGMKNIQYVPKDVKVKAGGTVRWTNTDSTTHTVTKQSGPGREFDSGNMRVGAKFEAKFDAPGEVIYICEIHPNQTGTVTVE